MATWNDFDLAISEVRYNSPHTHIEKVLVHSVTKGSGAVRAKIGSGSQWGRALAIVQLVAGKKIATGEKLDSGEYRLGAEVKIFRVNTTDYIKTKPDERESDNLENLPEF